MASRKKERKADREAKQAREAEMSAAASRADAVKWIVIGVVSVIFVGLLAFLIYNGKKGNDVNESAEVISFEETPHVIEPDVASEPAEMTGATDSAEAEAGQDENAEVVELVEFADLQCPTCKAYHPTIKNLLEENPNVRYVFKHFPLSIHQHSRRAAMAAEAAGAQGKFFEMVDMLFSNQDTWAGQANPGETFLGYAQELGLDIEKFKSDLENKELEARVQDNLNEGIEAGVGGTPTFFFNGKRYPGLPQNSVAAFEVIIQNELQNE